MPRRPVGARLPVVLVSGFLGAGKTTFVNRLLQRRRLRAAVFVNELGAVDVDGTLLRAQGGSAKVFSLADGCMCCGTKDDLANVIAEELGGCLDELDVLIVETSGVSDPAPILKMLNEADDMVYVAGVLCVLDATTVADPALGSCDGARRQIAEADLVLLSKVDLLSEPAAVTAAEKHVRALRRVATPSRRAAPRVLNTGDGDVDLTELCALRPPPSGKGTTSKRRKPTPVEHDGPSHKDEYPSMFFMQSGVFHRERFERWAASMPASVVRAKGLFWVKGDNRQFVWHFAGGRSGAIEPVKHKKEPDWRGCEVVVIGRYGGDWDPQSIEKNLEACLVRK